MPSFHFPATVRQAAAAQALQATLVSDPTPRVIVDASVRTLGQGHTQAAGRAPCPSIIFWRSQQDCATIFSMNAHPYQELERLSIAEKRLLCEALIVSADSEASAPFTTEAQRSELRTRLAYHRANPGEPGVTLSQLKDQLLASSR
ncbi:MAG: addiction module protein [Burkholderiales bacterium]|nr:addiction module protein [Burkholderiales bacterium]